MSARLSGHALHSEGWAFSTDGDRYLSATGMGCAKCECGALSSMLPNRSRRQAWHRAHKDEIRHGQPNLIRGGA